MNQKHLPAARHIPTASIWLVFLAFAVPGRCAPSVDFQAPPLGEYGPITGKVSGLVTPSDYEVILLTSQKNKTWWDKTHNVHGIPIAEDGTFTVPSSREKTGWINSPNVLRTAFIGVWVVPANFGKISVEGVPFPAAISQGAVAYKILIRTGPGTVPSVDFDAPAVGVNDRITGQVLGLPGPANYKVLMLVSAKPNVWWDKTHNVSGIPIAQDGSFRIDGWVVDPHDLTVPNIGVWIVPADFPKFSAEGVALPESIPQSAVASKIEHRTDDLLPPENAVSANAPSDGKLR
jgi:hypothetical protein